MTWLYISRRKQRENRFDFSSVISENPDEADLKSNPNSLLSKPVFLSFVLTVNSKLEQHRVIEI